MSVAVADNALITTTEFAAVFGSISDESDKYQTLINQASSRIELFTHRSLKSTAYATATALILDGTGTDTIIIPHHPVTAISKLYIDSSRAFGADTEILASRYRLRSLEGIIVLYDTYFPELVGCVKLECTAGYVSTSPEWQVLQSACMELVRWMSGRYGATGGIGMRAQSNAEGGSTTWETDIPANIRSMLQEFVEVEL